MNLPAGQRWQARETILTSDRGADEAALLDKRNGNYIGLDRVATSIWRLLASPRTLPELVEGIVNEYDVDPKIAQSDIISFLLKLEEVELIRSINP